MISRRALLGSSCAYSLAAGILWNPLKLALGADEPKAGLKKDAASKAQEKLWGVLSPQEHEAAVAGLKKFAEGAAVQIQAKLKLHETKFFLFYTDLNPTEARQWQALLDKMYTRLIGMFAIPKATNIWHGKALVLVFEKAQDYRRFEKEVKETDAAWSAGMCHTSSNGEVHIAFYRQEDPSKFAHILVHESVHGFIHRYRSPERPPSWVSEGLAEWIAGSVAAPQETTTKIRTAQNETVIMLRQAGGFEGIFEADAIGPQQYPVALAVTEFLIQLDRAGYVKFIDGIKDGQEWEEAFEAAFKMKFEQFLAGYAKALKLPQLRR